MTCSRINNEMKLIYSDVGLKTLKQAYMMFCLSITLAYYAVLLHFNSRLLTGCCSVIKGK